MLRSEIPETDYEDLRLAVVMNGGVSLAIWIGGVTHEINRLTQSKAGERDNVYAELLAIVRATARVDVIAGTSAGGINGAFLALASVYRRPLTTLGGLWARKGGFLDLFRPAMQGDPPSLMRGDEYFLPALRDAFDEVVPPQMRLKPIPPKDAPIHLIMTTTLMNGSLRRFADDFGNSVVEVEHKAQFVFARTRDTRPEDDPFAQDDVTSHLALASRSTASFPIAFEPSFIPVGKDGPDDLHPDMDREVRFPGSRYVLDGGVLVNKPVRPALAAIAAQPAGRQVRRVLAYVVPDPGTPKDPGPDKVEKRPSAGRVLLDSLVMLPRAQSIAEDLEELREQNRRVRTTRALRPEVTPALAPRFEELAPALFETYRLVRARRAVAHIADIVASQTMPPSDENVPPAWTLAELLVAFGCDGSALAESSALPFVPSVYPLTADGETEWDWGLAPAERLANVALDVFARAMAVAPWDATELRAELATRREALHDVLTALHSARGNDDRFWAEQARALGMPPEDTAVRADRVKEWATAALRRWPAGQKDTPETRALMLRSLEYTTFAIVRVLVAATPYLYQAARAGQGGHDDTEATRLSELLTGLGLPDAAPAGRRRRKNAPPDVPGDDVVEAVLRRIFAGEVALLALGVAPAGVEQSVELVQVSGDTPNAFGGPATVAKLAGVSMGHFGAFYKRSWRVSDWIWGRVDGSVRLCQILLSPARLRQLRFTTAELLPLLRAAATGTGTDAEALGRTFDANADRIADELRFLDEPDLPLPPSLPVTAALVARRIQGELLVDELDGLASAVCHDVDRGGARSNGVSFVRRYDAATAGGAKLAPTRALDLFAKAAIAEEMADEVGSDLMAVTAGRALAVGVSAANAEDNGLGPLRLLARSLRGVTLTAYALVFAATRRSKFGTAVSMAILAVAGALLALSLLADVPGPLKVVATVLVLGALVEALLRSAMWELGIAVAVPATAALAVLVAREDLRDLRENAGPVAGVVGAVAGLMLFGSVRRPGRLPFLARWKHRRWVLLAGLALTVATFLWMESVDHGNIVKLELCGWTRGIAARLLGDWPLAVADDYIWRDFPFLAVYWLPMTVAAGWAADRYTTRGFTRLATIGRNVAWLPLYAAAFDVVENAFLLREIHEAQRDGLAAYGQSGTPYLAPLATVAAWWKWVLLLVVVAYVVRSLLPKRRQTLTTASSTPAAAGPTAPA